VAIVANEAPASSVTTLRKRVRRLIGDNASSSARQRWSDADIDQAIIDQLSAMYAELAIDPAAFLTSTTFSYTANSESIAIPAAALYSPVYKVEDYTDSDSPFELLYQSPSNIDSYVSPFAVFAWTRSGNNLRYVPKPSTTRTLRIWYVKNPLLPYDATPYDSSGNPTISSATSQHPYPVAHEELIGVGAAIRLQEEDDEIPPHRLVRYEELWDRFRRQTRYNQGRRRVANVRRYY
jgi:hypothetical protein